MSDVPKEIWLVGPRWPLGEQYGCEYVCFDFETTPPGPRYIREDVVEEMLENGYDIGWLDGAEQERSENKSEKKVRKNEG